MKKPKEISTNESVSIPFVWKDKTPGGSNLGRAEFGVTLQFDKDARVKKFYVFAIQQRNVESYLLFLSGDIDFTIGSYDRLLEPKVWMIHKNTEIGGTCFHIYVPEDSKYLHVDYHGVNFGKSPLYKVVELCKL